MTGTPGKLKKPRGASAAAERKSIQIEVIIDAALAEIDERGLATFRIRNLAKRLNVYPGAVYWYVPSKNLILAQIVKRVLTDVVPRNPGAFWRDRLRELFVRFREAVRAHPNAAPLIGGTLIGNVTIDLDFVEAILSIVKEAGLRGRLLVAGYNTVVAALVGFVNEEFAVIPARGAGLIRQQVTSRLQTLPPDKYPALSENLPLLTNKAFALRWENGSTAPLSETFSYFIDVIIIGIEGLCSRQQASQSRV